ncbi:MAG: DUF2914 domain-containing protein [Candidatus Rokubacteria bacterium]|nr:DUF2914 domain-containing protein [Candidatus Rokubacteria bacterium]
MRTTTERLRSRWEAVKAGHALARWVARWGISVGSLLAGLATLFVFRRGLPDVGWIVGYLILLWFLFTLFTQIRQSLEGRGRRLVLAAGDYTIQTLYHGLLLFILPGYYASTTFSSVNAWFFLLLVGLTLLTSVDPWYAAVVRPRRWARCALFAVALFAALNVALPLVGVLPIWALEGSAVSSALALTPALRPPGGSWKAAWPRAAALAVLAALLLGYVRAGIPPAPLHLARAIAARAVTDMEPVDPFGVVSVAQLAEWGGMVAYTAVYAPVGLQQPIAHVWQKDAQPVGTVPLSPVRGGRAQGFRTYSQRSDLGPDPVGRWTVDVVTASGQLIGRLRFTVTP